MGMEELKAKVKETREKYLRDANARLKEIKAMRGDINRRKKDASAIILRDLEDQMVNIDMYINLADVEIEITDNSDEFNWEKHRLRVDDALGKAEREMERGYEILERPEKKMHRF
ncbi:hypothetical protein J2128_002086 [Methanomicrobium sp. W14]|jgi:hypothetical protein|uniref:hypothetical protein n=1 Tax=Methanomicrobium sp. W14 TaxID=2817839 RepID=UPI001AE7B2E7|nr:hypothetical protein [Methanomicrobium sp. W14]MBP2134120.1 hypothetical protein [Methanomicrobium sp. W14]